MNHQVIVLVLAAAVFHASWNFLAKRAAGSVGFVWLCGITTAILYTPILLVFVLVEKPHLNWLQTGFIFGTACLHVAYFFFLQRGYGVGDLSLAYPVARGTGPLISTLGAIVLLHERPAPVALLGIVLLGGGVLALMGDPRRILSGSANSRIVIGYALITSLFIAAYTIWDKYAISVLLISPLLFDGSSCLMRSVLYTPSVMGKWKQVWVTWKNFRREVLGVALLSPLAYVLILFAMSTCPVSYIAPMRECSVLIGTFMGARFLAEKHIWHRIGAACVILIGIMLLALA